MIHGQLVVSVPLIRDTKGEEEEGERESGKGLEGGL